jgi:Aldo/keto reductase family
MSYGKSRDIPDRAEMIELLPAAVDHGIDFLDTAETYGPFTNEEMVGEALAPVRHRVRIATKFGWDIDPDTGVYHGGVNSKPEHIIRAVEGSLKRLRTDHIDSSLPASRRSRSADRRCRRDRQADNRGRQGALFRPVRSRRSIDQCARTLCTPLLRCRASIRFGPSEPETEIIPTIEELGIGFVPYTPLGTGFLTGKIDEKLLSAVSICVVVSRASHPNSFMAQLPFRYRPCSASG